MKQTHTILKISGYLLLLAAFVTLFDGIVVTWRNEKPVDVYATITVLLIACGVFCIILSKRLEP